MFEVYCSVCGDSFQHDDPALTECKCCGVYGLKLRHLNNEGFELIMPANDVVANRHRAEVASKAVTSTTEIPRAWIPGPWLSSACLGLGLLVFIAAQLALIGAQADREGIHATRASLDAMPMERKYATYRDEEGNIGIESTGETRKSLRQLNGEIALIGAEMRNSTITEAVKIVRLLGTLLGCFGVGGIVLQVAKKDCLTVKLTAW